MNDIAARPEITARSHLRRNLGLDSLDHIELGMALEEEFGIEITDEHLEEAETVGDLVRLVARLQSEAK